MGFEDVGQSQEEIRNCAFCREFFPNKEKVVENEFAVAYYDGHPVSPGHVLVMPKEHVKDFRVLSQDQRHAIEDLVHETMNLLDETLDPKPIGYNIGVNIGEGAGQSVFHHHTHIIPRYEGDTENPQGGIRQMFPHGMDNYNPE